MQKLLYIICILYNKKLSDIKSLNQFLSLNQNKVQLIICDNSSAIICNQNEREYKDKYLDMLKYIPNYKNLGLSKAYNKCINMIVNKDCYIMFADDDTYFSDKYISNLLSEVERQEARIISGIVKTNTGKYFSPIKSFRIFPTRDLMVTKNGDYDDIVCINSGLTIHYSLLKLVGNYPEEIFLDMLDFWLAYKLSEHKVNHVRIIDGNIVQEFSNEKKDISSIERREIIYEKDFLTFCKITNKRKIVGYLMIVKRKTSILIKKIAFIINERRAKKCVQ